MVRWAAVCPAAWAAWAWTCNFDWASFEAQLETHGEVRREACFPKQKTRRNAGFLFWGKRLGDPVLLALHASEVREAVIAQVGEYIRHAFGRRLRCGVYFQVGIGRGFIGCRYASKRNDVSRPGFGINKFPITTGS